MADLDLRPAEDCETLVFNDCDQFMGCNLKQRAERESNTINLIKEGKPDVTLLRKLEFV